MITRYVVEYKQPYFLYTKTSVFLTLEDAARYAQTILDEKRGEKESCAISERTYPYDEKEVLAMNVADRNRFENGLVSKQWNTSSYRWCEWFHTREDLDRLRLKETKEESGKSRIKKSKEPDR